MLSKQSFRAWFSKVESRMKRKWNWKANPEAIAWENWFNAGMTPEQACDQYWACYNQLTEIGLIVPNSNGSWYNSYE